MKKSHATPLSITPTEKETAILLLTDLTAKQLISTKNLSFHGIQNQTKSIRQKMKASTIYGALGRMIAMKIITPEELERVCLPKGRAK